MVEPESLTHAQEAVRALRKVADPDAVRRPADIDRFVWSADLLDELARAVEIIGRIVDDHAGDADTVTRQAASLSQTITQHRNALIRRERSSRADDRSREDRGRSDARVAHSRGGSLASILMANEWAGTQAGAEEPNEGV
jgi:hypothetical protein